MSNRSRWSGTSLVDPKSLTISLRFVKDLPLTCRFYQATLGAMTSPRKLNLKSAVVAFGALLLTSQVALAANQTPSSPAAFQRVVAYFPAWAEPESLSQMPLDRLTHLVYAFLHVSDDGRCETLSDISQASDVLSQFKSLKAKHPGLKTVVAIGGASYSENFAKAARTDRSRQALVDSCMSVVDDYDFDGVDLDWEYPETKPQFQMLEKLASAFRESLGAKRSLSLAVPGGQDALHFPLQNLSSQIDWFGIMAYDRCDEESKETCHHSQFKNQEDDTGESSIQVYLDVGIKPQQLVYGLPFYGYKWKVPALDSQNTFGIGQKTRGRGAEISFRDLMAKLAADKNYVLNYDRDAEEPVVTNDTTHEVISFDNDRSLAFKRGEVLKRGLSGVMIWDLTQDDDEHTLLNAALGL